MSSTNKNNARVVFIAALIVVFVIIIDALRALIRALNTEPVILDEASKKILQDEKLIKDYYTAIKKVNRGEPGYITIEGEKYKVIRAGKHSQVIVSS